MVTRVDGLDQEYTASYEVILVVEEAPEGGYTARALGESNLPGDAECHLVGRCPALPQG